MYLDVFCVGIIHNIWGKRDRVKTYQNGTTSPLYELNNWMRVIVNYDQDEPKTKEVYESHLADKSPAYDPRQDEWLGELHNLIEKQKESQDRNARFRARVFYYSRFKYKNTRQFSIASGIPYRVSRAAFNEFKTMLEQTLKCRIS